jgi:hypothetical protein
VLTKTTKVLRQIAGLNKRHKDYRTGEPPSVPRCFVTLGCSVEDTPINTAIVKPDTTYEKHVVSDSFICVCCDVIILVVCEIVSTCVTNKWRKNWTFFEEVPYLNFLGNKSERRFSNYVFLTSVRISYKFISTVLTFESIRLTLCSTNFSIQKFCVLPTMHLCVLRGFQNKQRYIFLYTAIPYMFL